VSSESPLALLERWEAQGATARVVVLSGRLAVVELCTCHGELVDTLRSSDPELLRHLAERRREEGGSPARE
jgi:hypothetical protein